MIETTITLSPGMKGAKVTQTEAGARVAYGVYHLDIKRDHLQAWVDMLREHAEIFATRKDPTMKMTGPNNIYCKVWLDAAGAGELALALDLCLEERERITSEQVIKQFKEAAGNTWFEPLRREDYYGEQLEWRCGDRKIFAYFEENEEIGWEFFKLSNEIVDGILFEPNATPGELWTWLMGNE